MTPGNVGQFEELQVTDIELTFVAFAGMVMSLAGILFTTAVAATVSAFGFVLGALSSILAITQLEQIQGEINAS